MEQPADNKRLWNAAKHAPSHRLQFLNAQQRDMQERSFKNNVLLHVECNNRNVGLFLKYRQHDSMHCNLAHGSRINDMLFSSAQIHLATSGSRTCGVCRHVRCPLGLKEQGMQSMVHALCQLVGVDLAILDIRQCRNAC